MLVKICGIKRKEDALAAIKYGADAIGLLVGQKHTSEDFIDEVRAKNIVKSLPPFCTSVLVTHLTDVDEIARLAKTIEVSTIQLHGESTIDDIPKLRQLVPDIKINKAIHVVNESAIEFGKQFLEFVDAILLDTINKLKGQVGGTGVTHDWSISRKIVDDYNKPVILAGGLNFDNIQEAIRIVKPFGVDVNSGVKGVDGFKDYNKLAAFIMRAKSA